MVLTTIRYQSGEDVGAINSIISHYKFDVDAVVDRYVIDAKSVLGLYIFLFQDVDIIPHSTSYDELQELKEKLDQWKVEK